MSKENNQGLVFSESKIQERYADGIAAVHVTGNLVRIDFMSIQPQLNQSEGRPVYDVKDRIIMPLEGFVQSLEVQQEIVQKLLENGVLKRTPSVDVVIPAAAQGECKIISAQ